MLVTLTIAVIFFLSRTPGEDYLLASPSLTGTISNTLEHSLIDVKSLSISPAPDESSSNTHLITLVSQTGTKFTEMLFSALSINLRYTCNQHDQCETYITHNTAMISQSELSSMTQWFAWKVSDNARNFTMNTSPSVFEEEKLFTATDEAHAKIEALINTLSTGTLNSVIIKSKTNYGALGLPQHYLQISTNANKEGTAVWLHQWPLIEPPLP